MTASGTLGSLSSSSTRGLLKWLALAAIVLFNGYAIVLMYANGQYALALMTLVLVAAGIYIYLSHRAYVYRYVYPGVATMVLFILFPLIYTIGIAFTNYSATNLLSLERTEAYLQGQNYMQEGGDYGFGLYPAGDGAKYQVLLKSADDQWFASEPAELLDKKGMAANKSASAVTLEFKQVEGPPDTDKAKIKAVIRYKDYLGNVVARLPDGSEVRMNGLRKFSSLAPLYTKLSEAVALADGKQLSDPNLLRNNQTGELLLPNKETGFFEVVDPATGDFSGKTVPPGFTVGIGWYNFKQVVTDPGIKGPFVQIFIWTVVFAGLSVFLTLAIGLVMACLVQWEDLKGRGLYRVLLILPYAVPAFISILVFKGLFNQNFGEINMLLDAVFGAKPAWFSDPLLAKTMIIIVNVWLGFPYIMILCMGLLKSIPEDLYEASAIDGAGPVRNFFSITVPLMMKPLTPLLIASFAFNFNNFVLIFLLTNGAPDIIGASQPAGTTDLLVTYTYRIAFEGSGQNYGLASAIATLIFLMVGALALLNLKLSKIENI